MRNPRFDCLMEALDQAWEAFEEGDNDSLQLPFLGNLDKLRFAYDTNGELVGVSFTAYGKFGRYAFDTKTWCVHDFVEVRDLNEELCEELLAELAETYEID